MKKKGEKRCFVRETPSLPRHHIASSLLFAFACFFNSVLLAGADEDREKHGDSDGKNPSANFLLSYRFFIFLMGKNKTNK
jgi:hypothetical protein